ncbi:ferredoxin [Acetobacterium malicum]
MMKAKVDRDTCVGCGLCESVCPKVFEMNNDSIAEVIAEVITPENEACALEAQDECPVSAITVD